MCSLLRGDTSVEQEDIVFMLRQMLLFIFFLCFAQFSLYIWLYFALQDVAMTTSAREQPAKPGGSARKSLCGIISARLSKREKKRDSCIYFQLLLEVFTILLAKASPKVYFSATVSVQMDKWKWMSPIQLPATFVVLWIFLCQTEGRKSGIGLSFVFPNLPRHRTRGNVFHNGNRFSKLFHIH